jgi:hypothetical protein
LIAAYCLASPVHAAWAGDAASDPKEPATAASDKAVAVPVDAETGVGEDRISRLHAWLKVTPEEEADWNGVALAIRESAGAGRSGFE